MLWDLLKKKKKTEDAPAAAKPETAPVPAADTAAQQPAAPAPKSEKDAKIEKEIETELNKLSPDLLSQIKDPEIKNKIIEMAKMMMKDGVDLKSEKQIKAWLRKHPEAMGGAPMPKMETVRREEPKIGRNDPCPCGSGKKYKKCCGK